MTAELREINRGGRKLAVGSLVPCKRGVSLPLSDVCQLLVSLVSCTTALRQSARSPGSGALSCPCGKRKVNKTEVKADSVF